jgi:hypothetical protein
VVALVEVAEVVLALAAPFCMVAAVTEVLLILEVVETIEVEDKVLFELVLGIKEAEDVVGFTLELELVTFELVLDVFELGVPTMTVP